MIALDIAIGLVAITFLLSAYRIAKGPTPGDRAISSDLLTFSLVGLVALLGTRTANPATFDLVIVATLVAFLSAVSLARALTRGQR